MIANISNLIEVTMKLKELEITYASLYSTIIKQP